MRLGKTSKNTRRKDPRYFLFEQQEQEEKEFLELFTRVGNKISDEELLDFLNEADEPVSLGKSQKEELYVSVEAKKYMVNFIRRRIVQLGSLKLRGLLAVTTKTTFGGALVALFASGYGPKKLWRITSTDYLDKQVEKQLAKRFPRGKEVLYPGETGIMKIIKATIQSVMRTIRRNAEEKVKSLPEPDKRELEKAVAKQLEDLGDFDVEVSVDADTVQKKEQSAGGWGDWERSALPLVSEVSK